jgi:hypothetical protein
VLTWTSCRTAAITARASAGSLPRYRPAQVGTALASAATMAQPLLQPGDLVAPNRRRAYRPYLASPCSIGLVDLVIARTLTRAAYYFQLMTFCIAVPAGLPEGRGCD